MGGHIYRADSFSALRYPAVIIKSSFFISKDVILEDLHNSFGGKTTVVVILLCFDCFLELCMSAVAGLGLNNNIGIAHTCNEVVGNYLINLNKYLIFESVRCFSVSFKPNMGMA